LAKSYKSGGWCIAGRELSSTRKGKYKIGPWIRPVTCDEDSHGAVFNDDCEFDDGSCTEVLDIVKMPIDSHTPEPGQPENFLVVDDGIWEKIRACPDNSVSRFIDSPADLWLQDEMPTDQITSSYDETQNITQSLYLIKPENFRVTLAQEWNQYGNRYKRRITASFDYNQDHYEGLSITDPKIRRMLGGQYPGEGEDDNVITLRKGDDYYLCVSLGPRFGHHQRHYKFIATIFDYDGYIQRTY
jgi:hypothetical protein